MNMCVCIFISLHNDDDDGIKQSPSGFTHITTTTTTTNNDNNNNNTTTVNNTMGH